MDQLNDNFLAKNQNQMSFDFIRKGSNDEKVNFIENVVKQTDIPAHFVPMKNSSGSDKIFYECVDGEKRKREWLLFLNNRFYCVYCLCFSKLNSADTNRLIKGVEYEKGGRISEKLTCHEKESHHNLAKSTYINLINNFLSVEGAQKRNVITTIVKIIIYIATHGK